MFTTHLAWHLDIASHIVCRRHHDHDDYLASDLSLAATDCYERRYQQRHVL